MLALPLAQAEWGGRGFYEPDTARDSTDGYMQLNPDTHPSPSVRKVFFSSFTAHFLVGGNPNSAVLQGGLMPYPTSVHAVLGVWKDCNDDGYVGTIESGLLEYRSELLLDDSICKASPADPASPGFVPSHNDGQWVQELLWIGPDSALDCVDGAPVPTEAENNTNPYNYDDACARVWGDFGEPEEAGGESCPINPRPRGTYQSVGGFLRYADCLNGYRITGAINDAAHTAGQHELAFDDAPRDRPDQSESPLNADNPYGQPSDDPAVSVFDCSGEHTSVQDPTGDDMRRFGVADPTGTASNGLEDPTGQTGGEDNTHALTTEDGYLVAVNFTGDDGSLIRLHSPKVPSVNGDGSAAGAVNDTLEGSPNLGFNAVSTGIVGNRTFGGAECERDREDAFGENSDIYDLDEADFEATGAKRVQTDFYYNFREGTRGDPDRPLGAATPPAMGQGLHRDLKGVISPDTPYWFGDPGYVGSRNPYVNRNTLEPWGSVQVTLYAKVSPAAISTYGLSLPQGNALSVYGSPHCSGATEITGAFQCDPAKWWVGPDGEDIKSVWQVTVGEAYNLRDIDCWDATVSSDTPSVTAMVADNPCKR